MSRSASISLAALLWILLAGFIIMLDAEPGGSTRLHAASAGSAANAETHGDTNGEAKGETQPGLDAGGFRLPYEHYQLTQGLHGSEYGHAAIDLGAGDGAPLYAPISGTVVMNATDGLQNTVLVIENDRFVVTLMHGVYPVSHGEVVTIGDFIGTESNQGNTRDYDGVPCFYYGRDCGYHTHLNVFDKRRARNVNPLELLD